MKKEISRREFLKGAAGVAATAGLAGLGGAGLLHGLGGESVAAKKITNPMLATFPTAMCHAPMRMMYEKDFYKIHGPENFSLMVISGWDPVREGLLGGKLHYAYSGGLEGVIQIGKGGMPFVWTGGVHTGCILTGAQPEIKGYKDLKGKTIAVNVLGSFPFFITMSQLHAAGLDPWKDAKIIVVSPPDMIPAFRQKKVDAITMWDPIVPLLKELDIPHNVIFDCGKTKGWADKICCFGMMPRYMVEEHPGMVWQFNKCIEAASHWLAESDDNIRECVDIQIKKKYAPGVAKADFQYRLIKSYNFGVAGDQDLTYKSIEFYVDLARQFGAIKQDKKEMIDLIWRDYTKLPKEPI